MAETGSTESGGKLRFIIGDDEKNLETSTDPEEPSKDVKSQKGKSRFKVEFVDEGPQENDNVTVSAPKQTAENESADESGKKKGDGDQPQAKTQKKERTRTTSVVSVGSDISSVGPNSPGIAGQGETYYSMHNTQNLKTFGQNTQESLPKIEHYRNLFSATNAMKKRPTLLELRELDRKQDIEGVPEEVAVEQNGHVTPHTVEHELEIRPVGPRFGWITGVLVRCLLNIWGVMLFLRLSWVVGQAGIGLAAVIILLSGVVTTITALSMSAICTNGQVKGGGAYYMISRSLGPEFGGPIGLIFSVANAVAVAMYVVGFAETIRDLLKDYNRLMTDEINDVRIIGLITVLVLFGIAMLGMDWESKAQLVLLAILMVAIVNFIIGTFIPPTDYKRERGFVGYRGDVHNANWGQDFRSGESFFSVFSIFFPAATGILAGANISGDLKDAQKAIPKGTLLAILISTIVYIGMAWMAGSCIQRDAVTQCNAVIDAVSDINNTVLAVTATASDLTTTAATLGKNCSYGLHNDFQVFQLVSGWGPITIAGIISATLSSALASLVSAPKVFQAVCRDRLFPGIHVFAKGYGKSGEEPWRGYILALIIGIAFILIGELNAIAPLISNFFLMSYALINYSCFDASLAKSPGWRPAFRYYSMWLSLAGALLCLAVMFVINWWTALITFAVVAALYVYVHYRKPDVNWGSSTQAHVYRNALVSTLKLVSVLEHVKNFRPQLLVLSGPPSSRPSLVDFGGNITKNISLMVCGHVILDSSPDQLAEYKNMQAQTYKWLRERKIKSFFSAVTAPSLRNGFQALLQCVGMGKLRPNTVLMGFKRNWQTVDAKEVNEYFNIIQDAFDLNYGVGILRLPEGLDYNEVQNDDADVETCLLQPPDVENASSPSNQSYFSTADQAEGEEAFPVAAQPEGERSEQMTEAPAKTSSNPLTRVIGITRSNKGVLQGVNRFIRKQKKGFIDVWWLFDDGGLTLLIPYILSTKSHWSNCKLRVFTAGTKKGELDRDQRHMATMLSKFRIEYSSMQVIPDVGKRPKDESIKEFQKIINKWKSEDVPEELRVTDEDYTTQKERTYRHIRLRELLKEHSLAETSLIVMTLPMPKRGLSCPGLYMAWLETLTSDMPPILLLRGNQESVLTYYS